MPTFDITNILDKEGFKNAIDSVNREIANRYDFKGSESKIIDKDNNFYIIAETQNKLTQIIDLLARNIARKKIDTKSISFGENEKASGNTIRKRIITVEGIDKDNAQEIIKIIKSEKFKAQVSIQGEQLRVTAKKRDELQNIITKLKNISIKIPLNFTNFRD